MRLSEPLAYLPLSSDILQDNRKLRVVLTVPQRPLVDENLAGKRVGVSAPQVVITTLSGTRLLLTSATCCSVIPGFSAPVIEPFRLRVGGLLSQAAAKAATQSKGYMPLIYVPPGERNAREEETAPEKTCPNRGI
jgi:hypothetical protein